MLRLSYFLGNYYPVGGSQAFADELARRLEAHGGHLLTSTRVTRVLVQDGAARGVDLETTRGPLRGQRSVQAGVVVSNADLRQTIEGLLPAEAVAPAYHAAVRELRPSYPCFLTHVGLRDVPIEVLEAAQGYYWRTWDPDDVGGEALVCKVFVPTLYEPAMAPPGGQVVILQKVLAMDGDAVDDWPAHKRRVERRLLGHLERVVPGVESKIVVKLSASARTAQRFTLNQAGAMLGWEMSPDQLGDRRPGIRGPVRDLYLTGHWTRPGGGITPVILSAVQVADAVTKGTDLASAWDLEGRADGGAAAPRVPAPLSGSLGPP